MTETTIVEAQEPTPKKWTFTELRKYDGPLFAENLSQHLVTCNDEVDGKSIKVRLEPAGRQGCVDELPKLALSVKGMRNVITNGEVRLGFDEDVSEPVVIQSSDKLQKPRRSPIEFADGSVGPEDGWQEEQLQRNVCLTCGTKALQTKRQVRDGHPPLCMAHQADSNKYIGTVVKESNKPGGLGEWVFTPKISLDPVVRTR
jgi:hypothetical protein